MQTFTDTVYDVESISKYTRARLKEKVIKISVFFILFSSSVFLAVWFNAYVAAFIGGVAFALVFGILLFKQLKNLSLTDYSEISGEIVKFHKDVKVVSTTSVGGVGFGTQRKYDSYKRDEMRLVIAISDGTRKCTYRNKNTSEAHARYYEKRGGALHIFGTRFPVLLDTCGENWLCPICGEFNPREEKYCDRCNNKIMK